MSVITKHDGSIGLSMSLVNHLGPKEDSHEKFLAVGMVQNSDKVGYAELKYICTTAM